MCLESWLVRLTGFSRSFEQGRGPVSDSCAGLRRQWYGYVTVPGHGLDRSPEQQSPVV